MSAADNKRKIAEYFANLEAKVRDQVAPVVAETAVEYFKESFTTKGFDGIPWLPTKRAVSRGSLMVRSGALVNSIRPSVVEPDRVVISAGSSKVPYARVHNEGLHVTGTANVRQFTRRQGKKQTTVKAHSRKIDFQMPQRQFMGHSAELNRRIMARIKSIFNTP